MLKSGAYSLALADNLIAQLQSHVLSNVKERDLADGIPYINEALIAANFTDVTERNAEQRSVLAFSDASITKLKNCDPLVTGLPICNFNLQAAFKARIDRVTGRFINFFGV